MLEDAILRVAIAYQAVAAPPRSRTFGTHLLREQADVLVRRIPESEAPIMIEAHWTRGEPSAMRWRSSAGALWRPVISGDGRALTGPDAFLGLLEAEGEGQAIREWPDYPFTLHSPGGSWHGVAPFQALRALDVGSRKQADDLALAVGRAQATAADDLLIIGDVLHRRSPAPVWTVGHVAPVFHDPGNVRLAMPDYAARGIGYATFALDRKDDALAFAALAVERIGGLERMLRIGYEPQMAVADTGDRVEYGEMTFPGEDGNNLAQALESIEDGLSVGKFGEFSRGFRKAFSDFSVAAEAAVTAGNEDAALSHGGEAREALGRMIDHEDAEWGHTWHRIAEVMRTVRLQAWLQDFNASRTEFDRDMEAVGGFVP